jgi:hypothetical protein
LQTQVRGYFVSGENLHIGDNGALPEPQAGWNMQSQSGEQVRDLPLLDRPYVAGCACDQIENSEGIPGGY